MARHTRNRDRNQITYEMLKAMQGGGLFKSRIMAMSYLSYIQVNKYLNGLELLQLIRHEPDTKYYLTPKGNEFLTKYQELMDVFNTDKLINPES